MLLLYKVFLSSFAHLLIVGVHLLGGHWPLATRAKGTKAESRVQTAVRMAERASVGSCRETAYFIVAGVSYTRVVSVMGRKGWLIPT